MLISVLWYLNSKYHSYPVTVVTQGEVVLLSVLLWYLNSKYHSYPVTVVTQGEIVLIFVVLWYLNSKYHSYPVTVVTQGEIVLISVLSVISQREQVNFQWENDEVCFVLDQHAELDVYSASSLKQQSADRHVLPLRHIVLILSHPVFALSP